MYYDIEDDVKNRVDITDEVKNDVDDVNYDMADVSGTVHINDEM